MKMGKMLNVISILFLSIILIPSIFAIPGFPHEFRGDVLINGSPAIDGTLISAQITGKTVITNIQNPVETVNGSFGIESLSLLVQGEELEGSTIKFFVNGVDSGETAVFQYGGSSDSINLTVTIDTEDPYNGGGSNNNDNDNDNDNDDDDDDTPYDPDTDEDVNDDSQVEISDDAKFILDNLDVANTFDSNVSKDDLEVTLEDSVNVTNSLNKNNIDSISSKLDLEKKEQLEEIRNLLVESKDNKDIEVTTNIKTYKVKNKLDNKEVFRTKIELKLKAKNDLEKIVYIQEIPKNIALDVLDIIFNITPSEVLLEDPIVKWEFNNLKAGDIKDLSYYVKNKVETSVDLISLVAIVPNVEDNLNIDSDLDVDTIDDDFTSDEIVDNSHKSNVWLYLGILLVIGLLVLFIVKAKKSKY